MHPMSIFTSTARRRELGAGMRRCRECRGYTGMELAERLEWTTTMLSRAETGKRPMTIAEVASYTAMCGVSGEEQRALLALVDEPDQYRIKSHAGQLPDELRSLIFAESTASAIESFEPIFIPGMLQTREYARALFAGNGTVDDIDRWADIRMSRREPLTRYNPALCTFLVHEHALRMQVGAPKVMVEQLLHLVFSTGRPQCSIRVVPASAGSRGVAPGSFQIFSFPEDNPVIYQEHQTTGEFLENRQDLDVFRTVLRRLATVALDEAQSTQWMADLATDFERRGAAEHEGVAEE